MWIVEKDLSLTLKEKAIAKHFCCGNTLHPLIRLEKLIQISFLIAVEVWLIQK